jgi:DNA primase large subunit
MSFGRLIYYNVTLKEEKKRKLLEKIGQSQLQKEKNVNYTILPENEEDEALAKLVMLRKKRYYYYYYYFIVVAIVMNINT